jgi:hypothetical protein
MAKASMDWNILLTMFSRIKRQKSLFLLILPLTGSDCLSSACQYFETRHRIWFDPAGENRWNYCLEGHPIKQNRPNSAIEAFIGKLTPIEPVFEWTEQECTAKIR